MTGMPPHDTPAAPVGVVMGHQAASSQEFSVVLADARSLAVDDLVAVTTPDPEGAVIAYGVVTETHAQLEGATLPSDTQVIAAGQMPGEVSRTAEVQVVRVDPERWVAPHPGEPVRLARGVERSRALYEDTMTRRLAIGLARDGAPVNLDLDFVDGTKGGHISISGISGVATKTSTALALTRLLLEHPDMRNRARVLIFNVKGEDLLHLDRPNSTYAARDDRAGLDDRWRALGLAQPGPFPSVGLWAPGREDEPTIPRVGGAMREDIRVFGWTPLEFARQGLLRFCFTDASDMRGQLSFVAEQMQRELARQAVEVPGFPGELGLADSPGVHFADLDGFIDWITDLLDDEDWPGTHEGRRWVGRAAPGTLMAFTRRLHAARMRLRGLVRAGASAIPRGPGARDEPAVTVVHLTPLHDFAQRFVVGTLLAQTFEAKEAGARDPIDFVVLDELNKYAPREGQSPIKDTLIDIAQRGRSLGVILIGAQQQASLVAPEITQNAAVRISGRLDPAEAERPEYGWLTPAARARARLLMQGRMLVSQPSVPTSLAVELPFPPWATREGEASHAIRAEAAFAKYG